MPLLYPPHPGAIVVCDFSGLRMPEMVKVRPVVVVSPRRSEHSSLCAVIPLSTTPPNAIKPYHYRFAENPIPNKTNPTWAKCDMIYTMGTGRMDRVKIAHRTYVIPQITPEELAAIRDCVRFYLTL